MLSFNYRDSDNEDSYWNYNAESYYVWLHGDYGWAYDPNSRTKFDIEASQGFSLRFEREIL